MRGKNSQKRRLECPLCHAELLFCCLKGEKNKPNRAAREYLLGFPNEEVKYGFLNSLMPEYIENYSNGSGKDITALRRLAERGDVDGIRDVFTALFASIPYTDSRTGFEHDFQTVMIFPLRRQALFLSSVNNLNLYQGKSSVICLPRNGAISSR